MSNIFVVSRFYLYIHELLLKYVFVNGYYMARIGEDKFIDDPNVGLISSNEGG
jgi:hypothetical protein